MDGAPHRRFACAQPTSPPVAQARAKARTALRVALRSAQTQLLRWTPSITWKQGVSFHTHDVVTVIRSLVPITSMKASSLSFSIAPRPAFIEVETTVGPARARGRPRMRAVPYSDLCVSSRRSRGYEKPKRAFTGPLGSTQHRELRPAHRKRPSHRETKRASNGM